MIECIICAKQGCTTIHTQEEIRAKEFKGCYVCRRPVCIKVHTIEEIRNPMPPTAEEFRDCLRILIAYDKLVKHGDDQASTG